MDYIRSAAGVKARWPPGRHLTATKSEILQLNTKLLEAINENLPQEEIKAAEKITEDPSYFYKYINSFKTSKTGIGPLEQNGSLTSNPEDMANILNDFFCSIYDDTKTEPVEKLKEMYIEDILNGNQNNPSSDKSDSDKSD